MYDNLLFIIFEKLQFQNLINLIVINDDIVMYLIKKKYLFDCDIKKKIAIQLSNNGYGAELFSVSFFSKRKAKAEISDPDNKH
jgi:hypothetical protein